MRALVSREGTSVI